MKDEYWFQSREKMVKNQIINRGIVTKGVIDAFLKIPRHRFVDKESEAFAYEDYPLAIGHGQTISQPYIVALMSDALGISKTDRVLEIGTGSGYQAAILAELAKEVYTIERIPELHFEAKRILQELGYDNIHYRVGNGYLGWKEYAPFDKIIVTACANEMPEKLFEQMHLEGRMVIPLGDMYIQKLMLIVKDQQGNPRKQHLCYCRFVSMIDD
ncbi:MAG: protein-L-isoaspartate(D-aspartate) O-methyltransferase [Bacilli bacterium]|nr:protein-L-isoaspartate(D-aspartate) O-methyltransferase [Bacilli bacterium]MBN2696709.1 protein-L-isoaspartate(D-aspartate) O-methyltransferase [Bacilli bacterium]